MSSGSVGPAPMSILAVTPSTLFVSAVLLSIEQAVLIGVSGWLIARATGIEIGIMSMIVISLGIMFFSSTVPGLPMALGTFEFATVSLLGLWDVPAHNALAFAVLFRAILFVPPLFFGLFFLSREGLLSFNEIKAIASGGRGREPEAPESP